MKRFRSSPCFLVCALLILLVGCRQEGIQAEYGLFGSEAIVLLKQGETLSVLSLPADIVDGYALHTKLGKQLAVQDLLGIPPTGTFGTTSGNLALLRELSRTLASERLGVGEDQITDQMRLDAMFASAEDLRKTELDNTLQRLSGLDSVLDRFSDVKYCHYYDVGRFITIDTTTDWEALSLYIRQWLAEAMLLDRRRNIS
ncbi:hypothetical protein SpiGrapes_2981 [Sphaerochaeta pleomorpha str. Grapes]|uniref:Uncharacterized protein n=1 Tax=Sphaerochaeta pleomorpha (strain ATCC BAA-1885 / DSM 22778 / Grapes) TaxID=158190 RepID=G8QXT7_SPHPG|nr:hypothetical protein [Sphaerochaeta pleomorpha]AEV30731.1 hypothetical protein SpiGrapes_2981 [Sphaerochaeta pleomorpha str. Grapes]